MKTYKELIQKNNESFYQHMLKSVPRLDKFERASLKLKFIELNKDLIDAVIEDEEVIIKHNRTSNDYMIGYNQAKQDTVDILKDIKELL